MKVESHIIENVEQRALRNTGKQNFGIRLGQGAVPSVRGQQ